jgi:Spy/CpxP family protein refolding chaperone
MRKAFLKGGTMRRIALSAVAVAAALMIAGPSTYAKEGGKRYGDKKVSGEKCMMHGDMKGPGGPMFGDPAKMKKEYGLNDDQMKKIAAINNEHHKKMLEFREKMAPKEIQLERLLLEDAVDMGKVKSLLREISDVKVEVHMLMIQHRLDIEKVLTPEQKEKMKRHRKHMMKKMGPGPGGHHPDGPPERD